MLSMTLSKALHKLNEALNKHNKAVNKGLKELSKPLNKALHYVINELNKELHRLKKGIVHLRNFLHHQYQARDSSLGSYLQTIVRIVQLIHVLVRTVTLPQFTSSNIDLVTLISLFIQKRSVANIIIPTILYNRIKTSYCTSY